MKKLTLTLFLSGLCFVGFSQEATRADNIKTLLEMTGSGKLGLQVMNTMIASFKQSFPNTPEDFWDNVMKEVNPEMLIMMIIPIYEKHYSDKDVVQLIEFYRTPLGQKVIATTPNIMQESMQVGQIWGKELGEKVYSELKAKGHVAPE